MDQALEYAGSLARAGSDRKEWAEVAAFAAILAAANHFRPSKPEDETVGIGGFHRAKGWDETANELITFALLATYVLGLCAGFPGAPGDAPLLLKATHPLACLTLSAALVMALPKLPATELLFDFVLTNGLWVAVLSVATTVAAAASSTDGLGSLVAAGTLLHVVAAVQVAGLPLRLIAKGAITFKYLRVERVFMQAAAFCLFSVVPHAALLAGGSGGAAAARGLPAPFALVTEEGALRVLALVGLEGAVPPAVVDGIFAYVLPLCFPLAVACGGVVRAGWQALFQRYAAQRVKAQLEKETYESEQMGMVEEGAAAAGSPREAKRLKKKEEKKAAKKYGAVKK